MEWMMGLPEGHVTDVPGLTRNEMLKALGNGVVPQQAYAAQVIMAAGMAVALTTEAAGLLPTPTSQLQHDSQTHRSGSRSGELLLGGVALSLGGRG